MSLPYPDDFDSLPDHRAYTIPPRHPEQNEYQSPPRARQRGSSNAQMPNSYPIPPRPPPPAQPIFDAVNNAFDHSSAANQLPQDVIARITEQVRSQVIDSLRAEGLSAAYHHQGSQFNRPESRPQQDAAATSEEFSDTSDSTRFAEPPFGDYQTRNFNHTDRPFNPPGRTYTPSGRDNRSSTGSAFGDHDFSRASTFGSVAGLFANGSDNNDKIDLSGRYGDRSGDDNLRARPPPAARAKTDEEETVVEKMWQPLFDANGAPTPRLSQFLRGLALHLIEDFEPKRSLVVLPSKMSQFYRDTHLSSEQFDWDAVFTKLSPTALSKIYQTLRLPHHFVHDISTHPSQLYTSAPSIPALTPEGFSSWLTLMIRADPANEFSRLSQAVKNMPVSNADDRKERFPKELSRRLFPKQVDTQIRMQVASALPTVLNPAQSRQDSYPPPPPLSNRSQRTSDGHVERPAPNRFNSGPDTVPVLERERNPYVNRDISENKNSSFSHPATSASSGDPDLSTEGNTSSGNLPSIQIERERKPYVAKEGSGKIYEERAPFTTTYTESPTAMHSEFRDLKPPVRHGSDGHADVRPSSVAVDERDSAHPPPPRTHGQYRDSLHEYDVNLDHGAPKRTTSKSSRRTKSPISNPQVRSDNSIDHLPEEYYREGRRPTFEDDMSRDKDRRRGADRNHDRHHEEARLDRDGGRHYDDNRRLDDYESRHRNRYEGEGLHRTRSSDTRAHDHHYQQPPHSTRHGSLADTYGNAPLGSGERRYG